MQQIVYNGVEIKLARVSYSGRSVYDERDMVTGSYVITFTVNGIVYGTGPSDYVTNRAKIEALLTQPQKQFTWTVNGAVQWDIGTPDDISVSKDRRWGPKPRSVTVSDVSGGQACRVTFVLEATVSSCASPSDVEEFSWQFGYAFDRNFNCTRTINGKIRISSTASNPYEAAQSVASIALSDTNQNWFPAMPFGFYRDSSNYTLSPDGLTMNWTVVDKQVWRTLPRPLTDGHATMNVDQSGAIITKTLSGSFSAPFNQDKQIIAQFIIALITARFPGLFATGGATPDPITGGEFLRRFSITNHEFDNKIDFSITTQTSADQFIDKSTSAPYPVEGGKSIFSKVFGDVADVVPGTGDGWLQSNGESQTESMAGTAKLVPIPAGPFSTCTEGPFVPGVDNSGDDAVDDTAPPTNPSTGGEQPGGSFPPPDYGGNTSAPHNQFPYITFVDCYQYVQEYNNTVLQAASNDFTFSNAGTYTLTVPETVQQCARPKTMVIQTGLARRMGAMPEVPDFYAPFGGNGVLIRNEIRPSAPEFLADGQTLIYKTAWTKTYYLPGGWGMEGTTGPDGETPITPVAPNFNVDRPRSNLVDEATPDMAKKSKRFVDFVNPLTSNDGVEADIQGQYNADYPLPTS